MTYFYHSVVDSPHLPRDLSHDSTQNAVVTLLGEFWRYSPSLSVPSAALVDLLASMDVSAPAARAALSRLSRKGTLDVSRSGRNTGYSLSPAVAATIPASEMLTMTFGQHDREWDGDWTVIVFSIPETQRDQRQALRDWLRWLGFGPARDGVWISPHADLELTKRTLTGLLPPDGLTFRSAHLSGTIEPFDVWPLAEIRDLYRTFITEPPAGRLPAARRHGLPRRGASAIDLRAWPLARIPYGRSRPAARLPARGLAAARGTTAVRRGPRRVRRTGLSPRAQRGVAVRRRGRGSGSGAHCRRGDRAAPDAR